MTSRTSLKMISKHKHKSGTDSENEALLQRSPNKKTIDKMHQPIKFVHAAKKFFLPLAILTSATYFLLSLDWNEKWEVSIVQEDDFWNGCTQNFCDYSVKCRLESSRGNSTCCQEHSMKILLEMKDFFRDHNLNYWLHYGTLLGAIRDKEFISWETDVDIQVDDAAMEFLFPNEKGVKIYRKKGMPYKLKFFNDGIGRMCIVYNDEEKFPKSSWKFYKTPYVDLYPCTKRWDCNEECVHVKETASIREHAFPVSPCALKVLEEFYGKDWTIRKPGWHGDSDYEPASDELAKQIALDEVSAAQVTCQ